jgi:hypothetical protein
MMTNAKRTLAHLTRRLQDWRVAKMSDAEQTMRLNVLRARKVFNPGFAYSPELETTFWRLLMAAIFNRDDPVNEMAWMDFMEENGMADKIGRLSDVKVNVDYWTEDIKARVIEGAKMYGLYAE